MSDPNVYGDDWDEGFPPTPGWTFRTKRLVPPPSDLGMSLYELPPGERQPLYHFHHGCEELILVLAGTPTLRTPSGERELRAGDIVRFPTGRDGAHQVINRSGDAARYVIAASHRSPEVVEYPDSGKVAAASREGPLWTMHRLADAVDYFDGES